MYHTEVKHDDYHDYLHDGYLHHKHEDYYDERTLKISEKNQ